MFHIVNCTEMPTAYKKGNYTTVRATNSKLLSISNKLALRPVGSLQSNIKTTQQIVESNRIKRLSTKKCGLF